MQPLVGGQALVEGVMMRNKEKIAAVVRMPDGSLKERTEIYRSLPQRYPIFNIPILRGALALFEMTTVGIRLLLWSANVTSKKRTKDLTFWETVGILIVSLSWSIALFILVPLGITYILDNNTSFIDHNPYVFNLIYGVLKISIFLGYIKFASLLPDVHRVFQYHGAEHKAIYTYEQKKPLEVKYARDFTRLHPRCGTSFVVYALTISIIVFSIIPVQSAWYVNFLLRVLLLPVIAGIGYEVLKSTARHQDNPIAKALIWPGLQVQRITTQEPDDEQLEVGLRSLELALEK